MAWNAFGDRPKSMQKSGVGDERILLMDNVNYDHSPNLNWGGPEDTLFKKWVCERPSLAKDFSDDGIVDKEKFDSFWYPRIVIVLKEVNSEGAFSLRSFLNAGACNDNGFKAGRATWAPVQRWLVALSDKLGKGLKPGQENRKEALQTIAAVNVKKLHGKATADSKDVSKHARDDSEFLAKQLSLYFHKPTVFACGGHLVYEIVKCVLEKSIGVKLPVVKLQGSNIDFIEVSTGVYAFDIGHHPCMSSRKKHDRRFVDAVMAIHNKLNLAHEEALGADK